jgi:hypothetical protein
MTLEQTPAAKPGLGARLLPWIYGVVAVLGAILAVVRISEFITGPGCHSKSSLDTVKSIMRQNNVTNPSLSEISQTSTDDTETLCKATMVSGETRFEVTYRLYKDEAGKRMVEASWRRM